MAKNFNSVLTLQKEESIYSIMGRMDTLIDFFTLKKNFSKHLPFLKTYYLVTRRVSEKNVENSSYYENKKNLERLDILFASFYFSPLKNYLISKTKRTPWKTYYSYLEKKPESFISLLLGINAHINADLCTSLVKSNYTSRTDFLKINRILHNLIPSVMHFLAFEQLDLYGIGAMFFRQLVEKEFRRIVVCWREDAWENAKKVRTNQSLKRILHKKTEDNALKIILAFKENSGTTDLLEKLHQARVQL